MCMLDGVVQAAPLFEFTIGTVMSRGMCEALPQVYVCIILAIRALLRICIVV